MLSVEDTIESDTIESGLSYTESEPIRIEVRKRGNRYDFDDGGRATALAGKPSGWLAAAERFVAEQGFNVNRRGVSSSR